MDCFHQCSFLGHCHIGIGPCHFEVWIIFKLHVYNTVGSTFQSEMKSLTVWSVFLWLCTWHEGLSVNGFSVWFHLLWQQLSVPWGLSGYLLGLAFLYHCSLSNQKELCSLAKSCILCPPSSSSSTDWKMKTFLLCLSLYAIHYFWITETRSIWRYQYNFIILLSVWMSPLAVILMFFF